MLSHLAWPGPSTPAPSPYHTGPQGLAGHLGTPKTEPQTPRSLASTSSSPGIKLSGSHCFPPLATAIPKLNWPQGLCTGCSLCCSLSPRQPPSPSGLNSVSRPTYSCLPSQAHLALCSFTVQHAPPTSVISSEVLPHARSSAPIGILACLHFCVPSTQNRAWHPAGAP